MKYSEYLNTVIKKEGTQNLTCSALTDIMNIVYLEGAIASLSEAKRKNKHILAHKRYNDMIKKYELKLSRVTQNLLPAELFKLIA